MLARSPLFALAVLGACRTEYGISGPLTGASDPAPQALGGGVRRDVTPNDQRPQETVVRPHGPRATDRPRTRPAADQVVELGGGAATDTVDFLFVVDTSSSMSKVLDDVFAGFDALAEQHAFPANARIAVTGTSPSDPDRPGRPSPWLGHRHEVNRDPGFHGLVDARRIARYREAFPQQTEAFALDGCSAWFRPGETNRTGTPCLVAHTQSSLVGVGVEAGLTAFGQLLDRGDLFRTGAAVNVILVSDTQDPGVRATQAGFDELVAMRPTGEELAARVTDAASFRIHAIAPSSAECGEPWAHIGDVYGDAARATGGHVLDICTATPEAYVDLVRDLVEEGSVPTRGVVRLDRTAPVREVTVDGVPVPFKLSRNGQALVLDGGLPARRSAVRVRYGGAPE